jgi:hypothetical protein
MAMTTNASPILSRFPISSEKAQEIFDEIGEDFREEKYEIVLTAEAQFLFIRGDDFALARNFGKGWESSAAPPDNY